MPSKAAGTAIRAAAPRADLRDVRKTNSFAKARRPADGGPRGTRAGVDARTSQNRRGVAYAQRRLSMFGQATHAREVESTHVTDSERRRRNLLSAVVGAHLQDVGPAAHEPD